MSVRIGFIGVGGIAGSHLATLLQMPEVEVVALCDISPDQIKATQQSVNRRITEDRLRSIGEPGNTAGNGRADRLLEAVPYTDFRPMLRNEQLDAAYLCLPPFVHGDPEEAVIEAGLPMLVEKPVALELPVAARILDGIRRKEILVATGYQTRYTAYLQQARELLAGHTIGMALVMRFGQTPGVGWYHLQHRSGGQMIEMATHQVDMLRYLIGEVRTVYAAAATRINHRTQPDYDIFDVNCATFTFENGVIGNFANNFISGHGTPPDAQGLHIFCDGLTLSLSSVLRVISLDGVIERELDADGMPAEDQAFVQAVAEGRPELIRSDYRNGVRNLAVTIADEKSARMGQPVDVAKLLAEEAPNA